MTCWRLIFRHMRTAKRGALRDEWFDTAPRIKSGEHSPELLERIAQVLRPKLRVGKRLSWHDEEDDPERPSDLMSIDYEIEDESPTRKFFRRGQRMRRPTSMISF